MGKYKIGMIGCGNMGKAIVGGIIAAGIAGANEIIVSTHRESSAEGIKNSLGVEAVTDNAKVAREADTIFLAVKPNMFATVIPEIKDAVDDSKLVISIAAGQTIAAIEKAFGKQIRLIRSMPNTPALVGCAMSALVANDAAGDADREYAMKLFQSFGQAEFVPESMMDAVIGVSGSSPAYVYMFIEAMADAAVAEGMPRDKAYKFAAQSVLGSAKMVLETGEHPGKLKDAVCSPGGTTIAGVAELERQGFRNATIAGVRACVEKSRDMSK